MHTCIRVLLEHRTSATPPSTHAKTQHADGPRASLQAVANGDVARCVEIVRRRWRTHQCPAIPVLQDCWLPGLMTWRGRSYYFIYREMDFRIYPGRVRPAENTLTLVRVRSSAASPDKLRRQLCRRHAGAARKRFSRASTALAIVVVRRQLAFWLIAFATLRQCIPASRARNLAKPVPARLCFLSRASRVGACGDAMEGHHRFGVAGSIGGIEQRRDGAHPADCGIIPAVRAPGEKSIVLPGAFSKPLVWSGGRTLVQERRLPQQLRVLACVPPWDAVSKPTRLCCVSAYAPLVIRPSVSSHACFLLSDVNEHAVGVYVRCVSCVLALCVSHGSGGCRRVRAKGVRHSV